MTATWDFGEVAAGRTTYDPLGRAVLAVDPLGGATRLAYDLASRVTASCAITRSAGSRG